MIGIGSGMLRRNTTRRICIGDRSARQRMVGNHAVLDVRNVGPGCTTRLILAGAPLEPAIERGCAAIEKVKLVRVRQVARRPRPYDFHGDGCCLSFLSVAEIAGALCKARTKAPYCISLTKKCRRSRSASAAARFALSIMNSVRDFPSDFAA